ncbi:MAG: prolyl oligopeptidase family serine peptidase, partial [Cyclobacteriaceae bacterium]|nr:prolyl oligopeptidase family serine peptidase [Cyclobacteriaceae bacterium]
MKKITFISLIAVFISGAITLRAQEVITPLDVAKIQTVVEAIISTDGRFVAYTVTVPADPLKENKPSKRELYLYNVSTGKTLPYVTQGSVLSIAFRPGNFASITFLSKREGDQGVSLYEISLSGGESKKIYSAETSISGYHWSADGKKLAYIASEKKKSTKTESSLPYQPEVYEENLSRSLAHVYDTEKDVTDVIPLDGHTTEVAWSSDGSRLALLNAPSSLVDDKYMKQTIMIVQVSPFKWIGKVDHQGKMGKIAWSPDSKNIAFIAGEDIHDPEAGRLFIVGSEGGAPKNLKSDYAGSFDDFQWVDPKTLGFVSSVGVGAAYGTITGTGKAPVITFSTSELALHGLSLASDGAVVFVADSPRHPGEVYMLKKGEKSPARVTTHNTWLSDKKMARQEVIKYKAKDGLEIEGILIHPLNEQQGQRYPLITVVHGGPESHIDNGWLTGYSTPGQMAAAKGYAVFYPNYRGSTGRGAVFAKTSQGDLAGKEFDDIVDGVDYLVNSGLVDTKKVGVTGGSYGGYATGWMS